MFDERHGRAVVDVVQYRTVMKRPFKMRFSTARLVFRFDRLEISIRIDAENGDES
jgi:hypothetical protein